MSAPKNNTTFYRITVVSFLNNNPKTIAFLAFNLNGEVVVHLRTIVINPYPISDFFPISSLTFGGIMKIEFRYEIPVGVYDL